MDAPAQHPPDEGDFCAAFARDGFCLLRGILDEAALAPVRAFVAEHVADSVAALQAAGHVTATHSDAPFEERWARVSDEVIAMNGGDDEQLGVTTNWGPSTRGHGLLREAVHQLYTTPALATAAAALLGCEEEIWGCGPYWVRPMTANNNLGHYPYHQVKPHPPARPSGCYRPKKWS
jgi:hypothetical protein